jgi:hypothetical protein
MLQADRHSIPGNRAAGLFIAFICRHSCATVRTSGFEKTDSGARSTKSYDFPAFRFGGLALSGKTS